MKFKTTLRRMIELCSIAFVAFFLGTIISDEIIRSSAKFNTFSEVDQVPEGIETALVLGCSGSFDTKYTNPYFRYRMEACLKLYQSGKIKKFLLSGDNGRQGYNEPEEMKKALIKLGVPEDIIFLDFAGFRTLDSVVRAKKVFGQKKFIVVSQQFHNERAIYLAKQNDIDAIGFNAQDVTGRMNKNTSFREYLARVKAIIDINLLHKQPKFLGEQIEI